MSKANEICSTMDHIFSEYGHKMSNCLKKLPLLSVRNLYDAEKFKEPFEEYLGLAKQAKEEYFSLENIISDYLKEKGQTQPFTLPFKKSFEELCTPPNKEKMLESQQALSHAYDEETLYNVAIGKWLLNLPKEPSIIHALKFYFKDDVSAFVFKEKTDVEVADKIVEVLSSLNDSN